MEIKIKIDSSCKHCKAGLVYFKKLHKQNKNAYLGYKIKPNSKGEQEAINGIVLTPDYNSCGHLTHFHIRKQKKPVK